MVVNFPLQNSAESLFVLLMRTLCKKSQARLKADCSQMQGYESGYDRSWWAKERFLWWPQMESHILHSQGLNFGLRLKHQSMERQA